MNRHRITITMILSFTFPLFIIMWIGNYIVHDKGELSIEILGASQSNSSSASSPSASISMMMERGNIVMGFNQSNIVHTFKSTPTGGEIVISALDINDRETIEQIRNHTLVIQKEFLKGNLLSPS
jgi:hypothetical protein